ASADATAAPRRSRRTCPGPRWSAGRFRRHSCNVLILQRPLVPAGLAARTIDLHQRRALVEAAIEAESAARMERTPRGQVLEAGGQSLDRLQALGAHRDMRRGMQQ